MKILRPIGLLLLVCAVALPAHAQLDPGNFEIIQDGHVVGEIYVPDREPGAVAYTEHWVLFRQYVYPDAERTLRTTIRAARRQDESEEDFFARVRWGPGHRYVRVDATDTDSLPIR